MSRAIEVESLGKLYRLGEVGTGTLSHDLKRWWAKARGQGDPYAKVGQLNDRTKAASKNEYVWALKDISFNINKGDVVGIIGRNGAGKSTLLKVLSRITAPSEGNVRIKGRIASLLEVGTGFHTEMTGRENVFMNGTILGMTRYEIASKFDDIVDFAGVSKYIDTPVKRYSSGMMVRLGFAVAAFLEPEILIVDEVLAVGDFEFQERALGKMKEVSKNGGRTVLFVSHNMQAISILCKKSFLLKSGSLAMEGETESVINSYLLENKVDHSKLTYEKENKSDESRIEKLYLKTTRPNNIQDNGQPMSIVFEIDNKVKIDGAAIAIEIVNAYDERILNLTLYHNNMNFCDITGKFKLECVIPKCRLYMGNYRLKVHFTANYGRTKIEMLNDVCYFEVTMLNLERSYPWTINEMKYIEDYKWILS
ncbi:ABC transporter ATP-binding protein [Chryseolinea lacunae]|uniref:ABC transporter ATP-binding protein n=1 Tax=Chryseolinea lacunae TaxID=2801331 RepID=A0ABS1KZD9_9BACT|nr:ABC transporter ATP-binding protein [Chryseolinea lacunae]MBL0744037.1 ABC transporter ATP-binding protein [Chryseolinea lacunae]